MMKKEADMEDHGSAQRCDSLMVARSDDHGTKQDERPTWKQYHDKWRKSSPRAMSPLQEEEVEREQSEGEKRTEQTEEQGRLKLGAS